MASTLAPKCPALYILGRCLISSDWRARSGKSDGRQQGQENREKPLPLLLSSTGEFRMERRFPRSRIST